jgi:hypothetical protein
MPPSRLKTLWCLAVAYFSIKKLKVDFHSGHAFLRSFFFHTPGSGLLGFTIRVLSSSETSTVFPLVLSALSIRPKTIFFFKIYHGHQERVNIKLHLLCISEHQTTVVQGQLDLLAKIIALISCMEKRIMPLTILFSGQLFRHWVYVTLLQLDYIVLQ